MPVAAYMEYLREMARKIAYRGSFLKVLPGTAGTPSLYLDWDARHDPQEMQHYLLAANQAKKAKDGRALFIGIGLCAGKLGNRPVAAPLLLVPVEIEPNEEGPGLNHDIHWSSVALNYDLITAIIEGADTVDEEDFMGQPNQLSIASGKAVNDIELKLDKIITQSGRQQRLCDVAFAEELIDQLIAVVPAFRNNIFKPATPYRKDDLNGHLQANRLLWFNHRFAFMGNNPGELSAYEALNELCSIVPEQA